MRENYKAWGVNIDDFHGLKDEREKLLFLVKFGILAPSSHNTQPWKFSVGENNVDIFLDRERTLSVGDKDDRQSYISLGCALTNIGIAADYYGYRVETRYLGVEDSSPVARIFLSAKVDAVSSRNKNHLIFSIAKRKTNRSEYNNILPPVEFLQYIKTLSTAEEKIFIITDLSVKNRVADIALAASVAAAADKDFRRELSHYVKNNTTGSFFGMPCFGMGIPTLISYFAPLLVKYVNMNKVNQKKDEKLLKEKTPYLVVLASKENNAQAWMNIGEIFERIALKATELGLSTAMWAAPIQIGEYYKDIQVALGTEFRPQTFFRLGYPIKDVHNSPRLTSDKVMK